MDAIRKRILGLVEEYYQTHHANINTFVPGKSKVHYAGRFYDEKEMVAMVDSVLDFYLTLGPKSILFEEDFSRFVGCRHSVLTNSGSSSNLIMMSALLSRELKGRLKAGDEVITPALTFPTTLNPIVQNGLVPVFCDAEIDTLNIDTAQIEEAISKRTRAIFVPHTLGNPVQMDELERIAEENHLFLLEDCCDALGSKFSGRHVGTFGTAGTFSFYPSHHITIGEGGGIITDDDNFLRIIRSIRDWGRDCFCGINDSNALGACKNRFNYKLGEIIYDHRYIYTNIGYNLKPLDIQAAMGIEQLKKFPSFMAIREQNFKRLDALFKKYRHLFILPRSHPRANPCWFAYPITIDTTLFTRREFQIFLENRNIETRLIFAGNITRQPAYRDINKRTMGNLENSDRIMKDSFFLGIAPVIDKARMDYVCATIEEFIEEKEGS